MILRYVGLAVLMAMAALAPALTPASAQDVRSQGKSPDQIFASDCSSCHKTPRGLGKNAGMFGLQGFLREHYTVSSQTASVLAKYLEGQADAPAPAEPRRPNRKPAAKPADGKPADAKPAESRKPN